LSLIFKGATKSLCQGNVKVNILLNKLLGLKKKTFFLLKNDSLRVRDEIQFLISIGYE